MNYKTFDCIYLAPLCKGCPHVVKNRISVHCKDDIFIYHSVEQFIRDHNFKLFPVIRFVPYRSNNLYTCDKYDPANSCDLYYDSLNLPF